MCLLEQIARSYIIYVRTSWSGKQCDVPVAWSGVIDIMWLRAMACPIFHRDMSCWPSFPEDSCVRQESPGLSNVIRQPQKENLLYVGKISHLQRIISCGLVLPYQLPICYTIVAFHISGFEIKKYTTHLGL